MPSEAALDESVCPQRSTAVFTVTRWIRRVHLYLGLFLTPWMVMYALSTVVMNHREFLQTLYRTKTPTMIAERELDYCSALFPLTRPM